MAKDDEEVEVEAEEEEKQEDLEKETKEEEASGAHPLRRDVEESARIRKFIIM